MSRSTTPSLEEEYGPDAVPDPAAQSEFVWASVGDQRADDVSDLRQRVEQLEAELSRVRDHRDRLAAKADRVEELEQQVERLKNEKQTLIRARQDSPQIVSDGESTTSQRRGVRLWTYLKRHLFQ